MSRNKILLYYASLKVLLCDQFLQKWLAYNKEKKFIKFILSEWLVSYQGKN